MPERHFVKYTFLKVDPAWRRLDPEQRAAHKREFVAACEDFASERLLRAFSTVGTRGDCDLMLLVAGHEPGADPRVPRGALPERPDAVVLDPALVPRHDQALRVLRRVAPRGAAQALEVPVRLSVREDARVVPAVAGRALQGHAGAHPHRPRVPADRPQHELLVRARRPGVRRRVRDRRARRLPRPRAAPAHDRGLRLHQARHPDLHLRLDLGRARPRRRSTARPLPDALSLSP